MTKNILLLSNHTKYKHKHTWEQTQHVLYIFVAHLYKRKERKVRKCWHVNKENDADRVYFPPKPHRKYHSKYNFLQWKLNKHGLIMYPNWHLTTYITFINLAGLPHKIIINCNTIPSTTYPQQCSLQCP